MDSSNNGTSEVLSNVSGQTLQGICISDKLNSGMEIYNQSSARCWGRLRAKQPAGFLPETVPAPLSVLEKENVYFFEF